jgi:hypothetical protein
MNISICMYCAFFELAGNDGPFSSSVLLAAQQNSVKDHSTDVTSRSAILVAFHVFNVPSESIHSIRKQHRITFLFIVVSINSCII